MSRLKHKVNVLFPLTPHIIVVGYKDEINLSGIDPELGHMLAWCRQTYGDSMDWNHTNRIFMFATRAMAAQFKLTFG
jgi:hypothetical protein